MLDYLTDKNGKSFRHAKPYTIRDQQGNRYDLFGTGLAIPPFIDDVYLWDENNKLKIRKASELEIQEDSFDLLDLLGIVAGILIVLIPVAVFMGKIV